MAPKMRRRPAAVPVPRTRAAHGRFAPVADPSQLTRWGLLRRRQRLEAQAASVAAPEAPALAPATPPAAPAAASPAAPAAAASQGALLVAPSVLQVVTPPSVLPQDATPVPEALQLVRRAMAPGGGEAERGPLAGVAAVRSLIMDALHAAGRSVDEPLVLLLASTALRLLPRLRPGVLGRPPHHVAGALLGTAWALETTAGLPLGAAASPPAWNASPEEKARWSCMEALGVTSPTERSQTASLLRRMLMELPQL